MSGVESPLSVMPAPIVSVIIPVYNAECFIGECIESLQAQVFDDFEILAVDNGSTDGSMSVLEDLACEDPRITVFSSEGNAGVARNVGMENARGKYLLFLDADDFFAPELLRDAVGAAEAHHAQIVLFGGRRFDNEKQEPLKKYEFLRTDLLPEKEVFSARDCGINFFQITTPAPWSKLFLREYVEEKKLKFQSLQNSNDLFFTMAALSVADRIVAVKEDLVRYRVNIQDSLQGSKSRNPLCFIEALSALGEFIQSEGCCSALELTYQQQVLSTARYNLQSCSSDKVRLEILDALEDRNLIHPSCQELGDVEGGDHAAYLFSYVSAALAQRKRERMREWITPPSSRLVAPSRDGRDSVKVSVVIPAYNMAGYVEQTIECVLSQTLDDIEVICIDDGSSDETLSILLDEARKDSRVSVFTQKNSGLSASRNVGIAAARGEYLYFIDSDDLLEECTLETCCKIADADNLDIILFDASSFYESEELHRQHAVYDSYYTRMRSYDEVLRGPELMATMFAAGDYLPSACLYISRTDFVRRIGASFIPGVLHEDNAYTYELMMRAARASHRNLALYRRRVRENSIMTSNATFSRCYGYYACGCRMLQVAQELSGELGEDVRAAVLSIACTAVANAQSHFVNLAKGEEGGVLGMAAVERASFDIFVGAKSLGYKKASELESVRKKLARKQKELDKIKNSRSFKLGRLLTKPYRGIKKLFR